MKITNTFLQPLDLTCTSRKPYADEPVCYIPKDDGDLAAFEQSAKGKRVKAQYRVGLEKLKNFLISNGNSSRDEAAAEAIDDFAIKVEAGADGHFEEYVSGLYGLGKDALDSVCVDVEDDRIPLAERHSVVRNLAESLDVCSEGVCSNLIIAANELRLSVHGPRGHAKRAWENLFDQVILEFCRRMHGHREEYHIYEIHYVNGYRNYFADSLGLTGRKDEFIPESELEPHLEKATQLVNETITADALVKNLAESCLAEVRDHFKDYLDRPLTDTEAADCYKKYKSIDVALQSRYGKIECSLLMSADEDRGTADAPYTIIDKPDLLMRVIARNLRKASVLEKEKFKTEAREAVADGQGARQLKRITDHAYYVKEHVAKQSHARYRSVQPSDLNRFSLPEDRARLILRSALTSTIDRNQLRFFDPSAVWNAITTLPDGSPAAAAQWLTDLSHFAVKRYRDANPDANEFLLRKAQEKLAELELLHRQRALFQLMDAGEESLAVRVASSLSNFKVWDKTNGDTPLHFAVRKGCDQVLKELAPKVDVNAINLSRETPLMVAAQLGRDVEAVRTLLKANAHLRWRNLKGLNVLHIAASYGHVDILEVLKDHFPDDAFVDERTRGHETALMLAARFGQARAVRWLLDNKADPSLADRAGKKAFHLAAAYGHPAIVEILGSSMSDIDELSGGGSSALMLAACNGHVDAVRTLLTLGSKVETSDADGWTALHEAVDESHVEVARLLLDEKADVNAITEDNFTPMLLAMMERCERMIQLLRSRGGRLIDLNTPDEEGRTHLLRAVMDERWDDVEALVRWAEAEINCPDNNGITPLMEATRLNAPEEVIELLSPQSFFSFFRWLDG